MYEYAATIISVIDGDTVHADIDLGFQIHWQTKIRMLGINAPELKGKTIEAARLSRAFLASMVQDKTVTLRSHKDQPDKYGGRYLGQLLLPQADGELIDVNAKMIEAGHAVPFMV